MLKELNQIIEYIKNRKLSEANKDLLNNERVTDVAFKYGYESMDGFTRAFKFVGLSKRVPIQFEGVNNAIIELAKSITQEHNFMKEEGELTHLIGVLTTKENVSELLDVIEVPAYTWAVFPNEGPFPETLQKTYAKTFSEWLPVSDYEVIQAPGFSFTKMDKENLNKITI